MPTLIITEQYVTDHGPLARTRPVFELRCGTMTLGERLEWHYDGAYLEDDEVVHWVRDHLVDVHRDTLVERRSCAQVNESAGLPSDGVLVVDGALLALPGDPLPELEGPDELGVIHDVVDHRTDDHGELRPVLREQERPVYLRLGRRSAAAMAEQVGPDPRAWMRAAVAGQGGIPRRQLDNTEVRVMTYPWQLIEHNAEALTADFRHYGSQVVAGAVVDPSVAWLRAGRRLRAPGAAEDMVEGAAEDAAPVHIGCGSRVGAFVSFDVTAGPIIVGENVTIESHCHIKGPAYIGDGSTLWAFADIKEACSLGPRSRVCGQVEEVIFQGYMHKFHVGFVGHSYLGEGVNLGDQTVTSNLKNDRSPVEVHLGPEPERHINTGKLYAGSIIGDGSATGTNTNLTTGAVVEPLSTIVSAQATPKYISGLLSNGRHLPWPFTPAYNALRILLEDRLERSLPPGHEDLYRHVYEEMKSTRRRLRLRDTRRAAG